MPSRSARRWRRNASASASRRCASAASSSGATACCRKVRRHRATRGRSARHRCRYCYRSGRARSGRATDRRLDGSQPRAVSPAARGICEVSYNPRMKPLVGIIMGSKSDWDTLQSAADTLQRLGVPFETRVVSAHRTPDRCSSTPALLARAASKSSSPVPVARRICPA